MQIYGMNRRSTDGSGSNSDIIIHASGEGFNELGMFCEAVLKTFPEKQDIGLNSTYANVRKIAKELGQMTSPLNSNPKRLFTTT